MKRVFDLAATVILLLVFIVPMIIIALLVKATSKGPFFESNSFTFYVLGVTRKKASCEACL